MFTFDYGQKNVFLAFFKNIKCQKLGIEDKTITVIVAFFTHENKILWMKLSL